MPRTVSGSGDEQRHGHAAATRPRSKRSAILNASTVPSPPTIADIEHVVKENAAGETNDRGLREKRERRMRQGKVAVGHLAEGDALRGVENVAEIEQNRDVRILPEHDGGRREKKPGSGEPVAYCPARLKRAGSSSYHPRR
jgi:hypothetical protein